MVGCEGCDEGNQILTGAYRTAAAGHAVVGVAAVFGPGAALKVLGEVSELGLASEVGAAGGGEFAEGVGAVAGGTDDAVTGFRAVSDAGAADIKIHGFRPEPSGGSMNAKWFSESHEGASKFMEKFTDLTQVVEARVPRSVYERSFHEPNIDLTRPGFCV